jgi:hypothetical protein
MYRPHADDAEVERRIVGAIRRAQWHVDAARVELALKNLDYVWRKAGFNPGQPRVPAGNPDGGQWIGVGGGGEGLGFDDPRILSDAAPDDELKPGAQYASNRPPLGQFPGATPGQHARFAAAAARADSAIRQVQQIDPAWQPRVASLSAPHSIEGAIGHAEARALVAEARLRELASQPHGSLLEAYRASNATPDLFGGRWDTTNNTVAVATPNSQHLFFGTNSSAPTYTGRDSIAAARTVDAMVDRFPEIMNRNNIGGKPNDSFYHAEATILFRVRDAFGGTLMSRTLNITVDRPMCDSCREVLPSLGIHLGNPRVSYYDRRGLEGVMHEGRWQYWRRK